jgi:hypothetical protein
MALDKSQKKKRNNPQSQARSKTSKRDLDRTMKLARRGTVAIVLFTSCTLQLASRAPAESVDEKLWAIVALVLALFHVAYSIERRKLGHWAVEDLACLLRGELLIGCAIPLMIAAMGIALPDSWWALPLMGVSFGIVILFYEALEEAISSTVEREDLRHGTTRLGECKPFRIIGIDETIEEIAKRPHAPGLQRFLGWWLKPSSHPLLSRTRIVILAVMIMGCSSACAATVGNTVKSVVLQLEASSEPATGEGSIEGIAGAQPIVTWKTPIARVVSRPGSAPRGAPRPASWQTICPTLPEDGAPGWAKRELNALYLGGLSLHATPPPGTDGGCTGKAIVPEREHGAFVYTIGRNASGEIRSVAVDSHEFGPAIFLSPAAQRVIALIERGEGPVGGWPKLAVGSGDLSAAMSEQGTVLLVRPREHLTGDEDLAAPYVEMSPTVATAFAGAIREFGSWLWPLPPLHVGRYEEFRLASDPQGEHVTYRVRYDPSTGVARRDGYTYRLPQSPLSEADLKAEAEKAE